MRIRFSGVGRGQEGLQWDRDMPLHDPNQHASKVEASSGLPLTPQSRGLAGVPAAGAVRTVPLIQPPRTLLLPLPWQTHTIPSMIVALHLWRWKLKGAAAFRAALHNTPSVCTQTFQWEVTGSSA